MTSARSKSQTSRSAAVRIGQLAVAFFMARDMGKRGQAKKLEKLTMDRIKGKANE